LRKKLDLNTWNRKQHYEFFKDYDNPFYNICFNVDVTSLYKYSKEKGISFFLASLYLSCRAANKLEEFRYRIDGDEVFIYKNIHPFSTVLNDDKTFSFCEFEFQNSFLDFLINSKAKIKESIKNKTLNSKEYRKDVIHYTTIPWISLTGLTHARNFKTGDSIPKFVFGKLFSEGDKYFLPFCVEVNHALVDGYHVGQLNEEFLKLITNCRDILST